MSSWILRAEARMIVQFNMSQIGKYHSWRPPRSGSRLVERGRGSIAGCKGKGQDQIRTGFLKTLKRGRAERNLQ
jgi:hypothetical protein